MFIDSEFSSPSAQVFERPFVVIPEESSVKTKEPLKHSLWILPWVSNLPNNLQNPNESVLKRQN